MMAEMVKGNDSSRSNFVTQAVCEQKWRMQNRRQAGNTDVRQAKG